MLETARSILNEIDRVLTGVDQDEVDAVVRAILAADTTVVYGLGREGLVMRGFAMRLMHLGLPTAVVGDMTAPPVGKDWRLNNSVILPLTPLEAWVKSMS